MKIRNSSGLICAVIHMLMPLEGYCLDTTHTHPLVTAKIAESIKDADSISAYLELYEISPLPVNGIDPLKQFLYWGTDFDPKGLNAPGLTRDQKVEYLLKDQLAQYNSYDNVIDGAVQEDIPLIKAEHHFFHARTGRAFINSDDTDTSAVRSMKFFILGVDRMGGYTEEAKHTAFFEFGQALHHVEDMSSPAHIHHDVHLAPFEPEKDDYEGWYLPQMKLPEYFGAGLDEFFINIPAIVPMNNPWQDVWGIKANYPDSMVSTLHTMTTYQADLLFPEADYNLLDAIVDGGIIVETATVNLNTFFQPSGELAEMFPCPDVDESATGYDPLVDPDNKNCLHWEEDSDELAHWVIDSVGDFQHQYTNRSFPNDWWPVEVEDFSAIGNGFVGPFPENTNATGYSGKYYIEQLSLKNTTGVFSGLIPIGPVSPLGDAVVPEVMRSAFSEQWHVTDNITAPLLNGNKKRPLREVYARQILGRAVAYGAGFTELWYDIANTPPYLVKVEAKQIPDSTTQTSKVVYSAAWEDAFENEIDEYNSATDCFLYDAVCLAKEKDVSMVVSRALKYELNKISHIDNNENLILELTFNEPMAEVSEIRFGKHDAMGNCLETQSGCEIITPAPPPPDKQNIEVPVQETVAAKNGNPKQYGITHWKWQIEIDKTKLDGLNGKLQLTVKARDKNNHRNGDISSADKDWGGELDGSPARRNVVFAQQSVNSLTPNNYYPWYQVDGENDLPDEIAYSYDFEEGDQTHTLIFDTKAPTATITIDLTL